MKIKCKILLICVLILNLIIQPVIASESFNTITLYGKTDGDVEYVSVLALKAGTSRENVTMNDILYVNQGEVDDEGNFLISFPMFTDENYTLHSNLPFIAENEQDKKVVYVGTNGNDSNDGMTPSTAFATLKKACEQAFSIKEIILLNDATYSEPAEHQGNLTIKGNTSSVKLNLPSEISLAGDLTFDHLVLNGKSTIYANGHNFKVTQSVTSTATSFSTAAATTDRLTVYGGTKSGELVGDTNLTLLGGKYYRVYAGGQDSTVKGNTNVVFGGNANSGDGIDDDSSGCSPCYVYGGGKNGAVTGSTNITLQDNAVANHLIGAGELNGAADETNIYINGGKAMNVFGGSDSSWLANCDTHITMVAGTVESLFGGCQWTGMSGNTYITVKGGTVTRRIYTGCYNDWSSGWKSDRAVTGSTTLVLYPEANLCTEWELNRGVFVGSRTQTNKSTEYNMLIYLNGSHSTLSSTIGEWSSYDDVFFSHQDYTVIANQGGEVQHIGKGQIKMIPNNGYDGKINGQVFENYTVSNNATVNVSFEKKNFFINSLTASNNAASTTGTTDINANNTTNEIEPTLYIAVYEAEPNKFIGCDVQPATTGTKNFSINCKLEAGKKYIIKAFLWNGKLSPLTTYYSIEL